MTGLFEEKRNASEVVESFRSFLCASWTVINEVLLNHDWDDDAYFLEDWLDANWNLLVGRQLLGRESTLQPLTASMDEMMQKSSDYYLETVSGAPRTFLCIGADKGDGFTVCPPFDKVKLLGANGVTEIVPWDALQLRVAKNHLK